MDNMQGDKRQNKDSDLRFRKANAVLNELHHFVMTRHELLLYRKALHLFTFFPGLVCGHQSRIKTSYQRSIC